MNGNGTFQSDVELYEHLLKGHTIENINMPTLVRFDENQRLIAIMVGKKPIRRDLQFNPQDWRLHNEW